MEPFHVVVLLFLGLGAGVLGGLLGIGGSVIMIPVLGFVLGWPFHLAQAAAMTVNPAVALTAAIRHLRNNNLSVSTVKKVLPLSILCIAITAWLSNQMKAPWLEAGFGLFLIWVLWDQIRALMPSSKETETDPQGSSTRTTLTRTSLTGGLTGTVAGLLGIGGGLIQVPLLNRFCKLSMRNAIGSSSAIMFFTAIIGAVVKDISLSEILIESKSNLQVKHALIGALLLIPGALVGGWLGAKISGAISVKAIRVVFALLVSWAAFKMFYSSASVLLF